MKKYTQTLLNDGTLFKMSKEIVEYLINLAKKKNLKSLKYDNIEFEFFPSAPTQQVFKEPDAKELANPMPSDQDMLLWSTEERLSFEKEPSHEEQLAQELDDGSH